ncbi:hypothetical protein WSM22_11010 [Cytophagales bacterium WSM2-2]|nr:hypothetical protein WSM22_11010 [Cytophagales bacterium WSM2-2]
MLIGISCSIVKDSDVTSLDQLNQLKLTSIEIIQNLNGTSSPQSYKTAATDSIYATPATTTIDFNQKVSGTITKMTSIAWPSFTKTKMLFRSKITSTGIVIKNYFYKNGVPRACQVYQNNQLKEAYSFYYTSTWKLTDIRSRVYLSVPAADTIIYRDSLIYNSSGYISSLIRHFPSPLPAKSPVTINFSYQTFSSNGGLSLGGNGPISYNGYSYTFGNCNCPNSSGSTCSGCDVQVGNSYTSHYITQGLQVSNIVNQFQIQDIKVTNGNNGCGGSGGPNDYDTYYFHPLMLLKGMFSHGDILFNIYSIDWLQPGAQISGLLQKNESVIFNFNYVR